MSDALFSPSWYRVAALRPRIRAHAQIHRHAYRGKVWFVLHDHAAGRSHRFSPAAHHFIGLMDGERTVQALWEATSAKLGDEAPTQEEVIRLLGQLHAADALLCDVPPDSMEVFRRHQNLRIEEYELPALMADPDGMALFHIGVDMVSDVGPTIGGRRLALGAYAIGTVASFWLFERIAAFWG